MPTHRFSIVTIGRPTSTALLSIARACGDGARGVDGTGDGAAGIGDGAAAGADATGAGVGRGRANLPLHRGM
jgi:hypothetical protein